MFQFPVQFRFYALTLAGSGSEVFVGNKCNFFPLFEQRMDNRGAIDKHGPQAVTYTSASGT
jgi:hypothetical protein